MSSFLRDYLTGVGYRRGDILVPRPGVMPFGSGASDRYETKGGRVTVLAQSVLAPHQYEVVGERVKYRTPSERFLKTEINGHDWMKVGHDYFSWFK